MASSKTLRVERLKEEFQRRHVVVTVAERARVSQRDTLRDKEIAALRTLLAADPELTHAEVGKMVGVSKQAISAKLARADEDLDVRILDARKLVDDYELARLKYGRVSEHGTVADNELASDLEDEMDELRDQARLRYETEIEMLDGFASQLTTAETKARAAS